MQGTSESSVYLDYNATTPVAPLVLDAMLPFFGKSFGNAASAHSAGREAAAACDMAREALAALVGTAPAEIFFTSGATEANNLALRGSVSAGEARHRILVAATEHKSVLETSEAISGSSCSVLPVRSDGSLDIEALAAELDDTVAVVSVMLANNETGVINDLAPVAELVHQHGALLHSDVTQAVGKVDVDLRALGVDLASMSAHKLYGPKGVGALFVRRGVRVLPVSTGGGHERGLRPGTMNVPGIVGLGAAAQVAALEMASDTQRLGRLSSVLLERLTHLVGPVEVHGAGARRLPNTMNLHIPGVDAEALIANAPDVCISAGSACTAAVPEPSHVLRAMGVPAEVAWESIRVSLGRPTTEREIAAASQALAAAAARVRGLTSASPAADTHRSGETNAA